MEKSGLGRPSEQPGAGLWGHLHQGGSPEGRCAPRKSLVVRHSSALIFVFSAKVAGGSVKRWPQEGSDKQRSLNKTWILTCHGPASAMLSGHLPCSSANSWTESRPYRKQTSRLLGTTPPSSTKCRTSVPPESQASVVTVTGPLEHPRETAPAA